MLAGGFPESSQRRHRLRAHQPGMRYLRLFGHEHQMPLPTHRRGERVVFFRVARFPEKGVHHHQLAAVVSQPVQQLRVQRPVPRLTARLVELVEGRIVHQEERHPVGDGARTEPEQEIVAGIGPRLAGRGAPEQQARQPGQSRAEYRPAKGWVVDGEPHADLCGHSLNRRRPGAQPIFLLPHSLYTRAGSGNSCPGTDRITPSELSS